MGDNFDCHATVHTPVMECRIDLGHHDCRKMVGMREKWIMLETVEVQALLWIVDKDGYRQHITQVDSEEGVHEVLQKLLC